VEFIQGGGLDRARQMEKADLEEERRRLRSEQYAQSLRQPGEGGLRIHMRADGERMDYGDLLSAAREVLKDIFR
jgi:hypothetical protein